MSVPPRTVLDDAGARTRRRRLIAAGALGAVLVVLAALVLVLHRGGEDAAPAGASPATATATPAAAATVPPAAATSAAGTGTPVVEGAAATGPTAGGDAEPSALPEVALEAPAAVGNGIVATLPRIESIQGHATGPGNVDGPALRVTVRIQNDTAAPVPLDGVATNLYYGPDRSPASPLDDASVSPFTGTLAAGGSVEAVYVFSVPTDQRSAVTVEVGYQAGAPLLLFTGPVD